MFRRQFTTLTAAAAGAALLKPAPADALGPQRDQMIAWDVMKITNSSGHTMAITDFKKSVLVVNLWASWCSNCLGELSSMKSLQTAVGEDAVDVALVSYPKYASADRIFASTHEIPFPMYSVNHHIGERVWRAAFSDDGILSLPQTLVYTGVDRVMRFRRIGGINWDTPNMRFLFRSYVHDAHTNFGWPEGYKRPIQLSNQHT